jgi:hypothetical protein
MEIETFYLVEVPGGDRRYIWRDMPPERYEDLKKQKEGTRIFKVQVPIPERAGQNSDVVVKTPVAEEV